MGIFIALGDLHSQMKTLDRLELVQKKYQKYDPTTVFIGDYIDTFYTNSGFNLLKKIYDMKKSDPMHTIVLKGNHEQSATDYFSDVKKDSWLKFGGEDTLMEATKNLGNTGDFSKRRELALKGYGSLIDWMSNLPLIYQPEKSKIVFVHAGLDLLLDNPVRDTTDFDRLWMRATYWYDANFWGTFGKNKLNFSIVSGHTPTSKISGKYFDDQGPIKKESDNNTILTIRYPNEFPRYIIDGGVGEYPQAFGNIGVFDGGTGRLIDCFED